MRIFRKKKPRSVVHIRGLLDSTFTPLSSLKAAQEDDSGYVVFHGDDGGQIYITCPAKQVKCSERELKEILHKVDARYWNNPRTADVYFEHARPGHGVPGGMGGGLLDVKLWIHPELVDLKDVIKKDLLSE